MLSWPGRLAVTLFAACLLAGCQPAAPSPTPVPTYACTPEAGGAEFSCSQQQYDEMVAKDKLYAEAEAVYRRFFAENERIYRAGGIDSASQILLETTAAQYLEDSMNLYRSMRETHTKLVGGDIRLRSIERLPGSALGDSVAAMRACIDTTSTDIYVDGTRSDKGYLGVEQLYFGRFGGVLKIQASEWEEVKEC